MSMNRSETLAATDAATASEKNPRLMLTATTADRVPRTTRGDQDPKQRDGDVHRDVDPREHAPYADALGENDLRTIDEIQDQGAAADAVKTDVRSWVDGSAR